MAGHRSGNVVLEEGFVLQDDSIKSALQREPNSPYIWPKCCYMIVSNCDAVSEKKKELIGKASHINFNTANKQKNLCFRHDGHDVMHDIRYGSFAMRCFCVDSQREISNDHSISSDNCQDGSIFMPSFNKFFNQQTRFSDFYLFLPERSLIGFRVCISAKLFAQKT